MTITFYFAAMNSGKTTAALNTRFHLLASGRAVLLVTKHDRQQGRVTSRLGIDAPAVVLNDTVDALTAACVQGRPDVIIVDEAQFLTVEQVDALAGWADDHGCDVVCYGLRSDFRGHLFDGTRRLMELADELHMLQVQSRCWCGNVGQFNARIIDGQVTTDGPTVLVDDGTVHYEVLCRRHFRDGTTRQQADDDVPSAA